MKVKSTRTDKHGGLVIILDNGYKISVYDRLQGPTKKQSIDIGKIKVNVHYSSKSNRPEEVESSRVSKESSPADYDKCLDFCNNNKDKYPDLTKMIMIGISTGLRFSDIENRTYADFFSGNEIIERKTKKIRRKLYAPNALKDFLASFAHEPSDKVISKSYHSLRLQLKKINDQYQLAEHIGTHSFRKAFGKKFYEVSNDIELLSHYLNHASTKTTRIYIGLSDSDMFDVMDKM